MKRLLCCMKQQFLRLLPGFLIMLLLACQAVPEKVTAAGTTSQAVVYHQHTNSCYTNTRCGGSCEQVDYFLEGCDCGPGHPCSDHGCYWEDPNSLYPSGCWHCYCPKGKVWRCSKCGRKSSGSSCSYGEVKLTCGKSENTAVARISVEKGTTEWCKQLELIANIELSGAVPDENPYVWNGTAGKENVYTVTENGIYTFELKADSNSNTSGAKVSINVENIDNTSPHINSYEQTNAEGWTSQPVQLIVQDMQDLQPDGSAGCGLDEAPLSFNGGDWTSETTFTCEDSGTYTIQVRDKLGNTGEIQVEITNVDVTGPEVTVDWDKTPNLGEVTVLISAEDLQKDGSTGSGLDQLPYSYDGGETWTDENIFQVKENGSYTILVKDALGNVTEKVIEITNLDKTAPVVETEITPEEWFGSGMVTITVHAVDDGCGLGEMPYSFDNGENWTAENKLEVSEAGTYPVLVRDKLENIAQTAVEIVNLDKTAPEAEISVSPDKWYGDQKVTITVTASDTDSGLADKPYSWDRGETWTEEAAYETDKEGIYTVLVQDKNGNVTELEVTVEKKKKENHNSGSDHGNGGDDNNSSNDSNNSEDNDANSSVNDSNSNGNDGAGNADLDNADQSDADLSGSDHAGTSSSTDGTEANNTNTQKDAADRSSENTGSSKGKNKNESSTGRTLSSLTERLKDLKDGIEKDNTEEASVSNNSAAEDETFVEEVTVKESEALELPDEVKDRSMFRLIKENPGKTAVIAASSALLLSVISLLLFMLLMGIRVYTEQENGRYRLLGMRICRRCEDGFLLVLTQAMTVKSETGRYRLRPGLLFAMLNQDEVMLVEAEEEQSQISVKISKNMEFRL